MLDIPQFVIDASISSASEASKSSESEKLRSLTESKPGPKSSGVPAATTDDGGTGQPEPTSGSGEAGGVNDGGDGSDGGTGDGANGGDTTNNGGTGSKNTPAIVGGAIAGLIGMLLMILAYYLIRRNKWKCTMKRNSSKEKNDNTKNRMSRSERKKSYKNTYVKENHSHENRDSSESSRRDSRSYTPAPGPARGFGAAAPTQNTSSGSDGGGGGGGGLSSLFSWMKKKEKKGPTITKNTYNSTSNYPSPASSGAAAPVPQYREQKAGSTYAPQQQQYPAPQPYDATGMVHEQQQVPTVYPSPNVNSDSVSNAQNDRLGGNGNDIRLSNQGPPSANRYPQSQSQSQQFTPPVNSGYTSTSVQASGPTLSGPDTQSGLALAAAYQQPQATGNSSTSAVYQQRQSTGNSSAPLAPAPAQATTSTTTTTTESSPPPAHNFVFAFDNNNYTTNHTPSTNQNENSRHSGSRAASYQQAQLTGNSSVAGPNTAAQAAGLPQEQGNLGGASTNTYATRMTPQGTGFSANGNSRRSSYSSAVTGFQQPQLTGNSFPVVDPRQTGMSAPSVNAYATRMTPQGTGTSIRTSTSNDTRRERGSSTTAVPGSQQQPQFTGDSNNSTAGPAPAPSASASASAEASANASVNLDISQQHHYYHHASENGVSAGVPMTSPSQSQSQPGQQQSRYMDSSTMTSNVDNHNNKSSDETENGDVTSPVGVGGARGVTAAAEYQQPQLTGVSNSTTGMTGTTRDSAVDARYWQQQQRNLQNYQNYQNYQVTDNSTNNVAMIGVGYQGLAGDQQPKQQQQPQLTGTTEATMTTPFEGYEVDKGVGVGSGAWYQRPVGLQSDEPIELEAHPAVRKVD